MTYCKITLLLALLLAGSVLGQDEDTLPVGAVAERAITASSSLEEFRPVGEYRIWRYYGNKTTLGQITSIVKGRVEKNGQSAIEVEETMRLDYTLLGGERKVFTQGTTYFSNSGHFVATELEIGDTLHSERFNLNCTGESISGNYTRGGVEQTLEMAVGCDRFFWDMHLIDQLEVYLAMQDIEIGTRFEDSIFQPQSLMSTRIVGEAAYFMWQEIYRGKIDSVFIIRLTEPIESQLYFTPDKRLLRVDLIQQGIRVYQDVVAVTTAAVKTVSAESEPSFGVRHLLFKLPHYVAFVVVTVITLLMFSAAGFKWSLSYLFLATGAVLFLVVPLIANPLVVFIVETWLGPAMAEGGSLYLLGIVPSVVLGIFQVGTLWAGMAALVAWLKPKEYRLIGLGAFLGGGMALAEACYGAGLQVTVLLDWPLAERIAFILLQVVSGALIGWVFMWLDERRILIPAFLLPVAVVTRYLPLLVPGGLVDIEVIHFVLIVGMILYLLVATLTIKKSSGRTAADVETD